MGFIDVLFGRPLASTEDEGERITPAQGDSYVLGLDAFEFCSLRAGGRPLDDFAAFGAGGGPVHCAVDGGDHWAAG